MENRLARRSRKHRETCNNPGGRRRWVGFYMGLSLGQELDWRADWG